MFTGIIEEVGKISGFEKRGDGARIKIGAKLVTENTIEGDSISVSGVCLTALDIKTDSFSADVSNETLRRSTIGNLEINSLVNLERAATPSTRLGGHIVQGHVDGKGRFINASKSGDFWTLRVGFPPELARYMVYKGSIAIEGVSLTIADLTQDYFEIALIPKTWQLTNFSALQPNAEVNLEADVIAKYVERILLYGKKDEGLTTEKLENLGFA